MHILLRRKAKQLQVKILLGQISQISLSGNSDATGVSAEPSSEGAVMKSRGGFGHLGITVPDVYKECERLHRHGVEMFKSPNGGGIRGIAFIRDPDGYAIEILTHQPIGPQLREVDCLGNKAKEGQGVV